MEAIKPDPTAHRTGLSPGSEAAGAGEQASRRSPRFEERGSGECLWFAPAIGFPGSFSNDVVAQGCSALMKRFMSGLLIALERCRPAPGSRLSL